jgi:hypothetical protein
VIALATDSPLLRRFAGELALAPPELCHYPAADREAARLAWATRIVDEYRSVAVFAELLQLLADLEAPFAVLCAVQEIIGDELRHTRMMAEVVDWLGGMADLAIDLSAIGLPPSAPDELPAARARRIVGRELVVAEEESIHVLAAYRDATSEPAIRAVLADVLTDEVRHAAAGRAILAALGGATAELAAEMAADRARLRADYASGACGGPGRALGACIELADLRVK